MSQSDIIISIVYLGKDSRKPSSLDQGQLITTPSGTKQGLVFRLIPNLTD